MSKLLSIFLTIIISTISIPVFAGADIRFYQCAEWRDIDHSTKEKIKRSSGEIIDWLKSESYDLIWDNFHPIIKEKKSKENFLKSLEMIKPRMAIAQKVSFADSRLITFTRIPLFMGKSEAPISVVCGSKNIKNEKHLHFQSIPGFKKMIVAFYNVQSTPISRKLAIIFGSDKKSLKCINLTMTPATIEDNDFSFYENLGDNWINEKKYFPAMYAYNTSLKLSMPSWGFQTNHSKRILQKIKVLLENKEIKNKASKWDINGVSYQILRMDTMDAVNDLSPTLSYITKHDLSEETISKESKMLLSHLKKEYPDFGTYFQKILFRAYTEPPISPTKYYNFYGVVLSIN